MRATVTVAEGADTALLRREAGAWLRQLRESKGLSQRALADRLGMEYYTFVSQIESGRGRLPIERYGDWARALEVNPKEFVKTMLKYYEPSIYKILFDEERERCSEDLRRA